MERRPSPNQFTMLAPRLNTGPTQSRYSIKTCHLWPGQGALNSWEDRGLEKGSLRFESICSLPCAPRVGPGPGGQGVGSSPCLPWKEVTMLKK